MTFVNHRCTGGFTYFTLHFIHATFCIEPRKSKTNKTAKEKKELETLKKQRDHYKKQMDYAGDHDHQRGRGGN